MGDLTRDDLEMMAVGLLAVGAAVAVFLLSEWVDVSAGGWTLLDKVYPWLMFR